MASSQLDQDDSTHVVASDQDQLPRSVLILYATESGNAEDAARRVARRLQELDLHVKLMSADRYPLEDLISEHLVLFVVSTTGAGKEPRALTPLWTSLRRADLPDDLFEDLRFGVFGLGDTAYERFCWPAKLLQRRLESLGAHAILDRGEGDDQHRLGLDGALMPWIRDLSVKLTELYPLDQPRPPAKDGPYPPSVRLVPASDTDGRAQVPEPRNEFGFEATVHQNVRTTAEDWEQDVRHIVFKLPSDAIYKPGDVAVIYPLADLADVESVLETAGFTDIDATLELFPTHDYAITPHIPLKTSLRVLLTRHLSFASVPRRAWFELVHHFASDPIESEKLKDFASEEGEGADDMYEYVTRPRRTIREVLQDFHSIQIPLDYVFDIFPPTRPRLFSIASSLLQHPEELHLLVAIVRFRTIMRAPRTGACTTYLSQLRSGDKLRIDVQKGDLAWNSSLPLDKPVICVGPGTGVAPMRALLQERAALGANANTLYFGCRHADLDQHFAAEWKDMSSSQVLTYRLAASRDGPDGQARTYVQDLIGADKIRVADVIRRGGKVFISGSANKMPLAVRNAVVGVLKADGMGDEDAEAYVRGMERDGRWVEECWS